VIGLGVGEAHARWLRDDPRCRLVWLCDLSQDRLAELAPAFPGAKSTPHEAQVLEDPEVDLVCIASYDQDHHRQIMQALQNGKHVFVEKPVCQTPGQLAEIEALHRARPGLGLASNLIMRAYPRFRALKEMVGRGELGELFYLEASYNYGRLHKITEGWRGRQEFYSVVQGGGVHLIDLISWITGQPVVEVAAMGNRIASQGSQFRFNDLAACLLRLANGMLAKLSVNFGCVFPHFHEFAAYGTEATFVNGLERGLVYRSRDRRQPPEAVEAAYPGAGKAEVLEGFVGALLGEGSSLIQPEEVFQSMRVCFALEQAMEQSCQVKVSHD
jgi:predicted dehydrogenase